MQIKKGLGSSAIGLASAAILLWSFQASITSRLVTAISPLLLVGIGLTVGGLTGLVRIRDWRVPPLALGIGVISLAGYHVLLFSAYQHAPVIEANLVNYLWPLLIVLFTPLFFPSRRLSWRHWIGGLLGFAGVALIVTGGYFHFDSGALLGYLLAATAAVVWAVYSLLTKRLPSFPSGAVGGFCLGGGLLALAVYAAQGAQGWRMSLLAWPTWAWLILIGVGPFGLAFFAWDAALKRGDPRVIGSLSFLTPMLSTLWLVLLGGRSFTWVSAAAMALIVTGSAMGSLASRSQSETGERQG
jgi:drug/metabolite transporter (DMT)-like permease